MISDTHRRLRDATHPSHQRLEHRIDILRRVRTLAGRRLLAQRFHALHGEAEAALAPWLSHVEGLEFEHRRRSPLLARDLAKLGASPSPGPRDPIIVHGVAEALGRLYVLEGSTLGGRVIRREVAAAGGDMDGLSFLDPYGARTGERWRSFLDVVADEPDVEAMVAGAVAGFAHAEARLCDETAVHG